MAKIHFCPGKWLPKIFLLGRNPEKYHTVTSNGGNPPHRHQKNHHAIDHQVTNQKALRQAVQLPLQQKNHHTDLHTVAPGLCTVIFPPITYYR